MILSGWILPDFYEVKCRSCSTFNGHVAVVKRYLNNLKGKDTKTYDKIMNELSKLSNIDFDDFAVIKLGWIKVNNEPINILFYTQNSETEFIIEHYINLGYSTILLEKDLPIIHTHIPSNKLI